ncbi:prolyl oligopeptidase family protein [Parvularcula bermudensis HTCC2503]|uniref:Prolyl oligopeptidase family protein n=1 Tax=Parvularcula bermudensis (strain ATCC BAA-594 / HTCC2503 / KCTC 12087) TaxID=314260 RepID=E0TCG9_PARBH|nr:prolyl oligopeptidase family serine peptidase [Parvularcula bermudensis]ADM10325.1 prolyl oligopeptidase family protein [Parvularcula bermudensis HTCC2503]
MRKLGRTKWVSVAAWLTVWGAQGQAEPIPVEALSREPEMTSLSMSAEGDYLVGLVSPAGNDGEKLALAVWDLEKGGEPKLTAPNDRIRFIAAQALKADKLFFLTSQAWTGTLQGCGEGRRVGSTATFLNKLYMTDTAMDDFEEPFTGARRLGNSDATERCFEIAGEAGLYQDLPLDPTDVIAQRVNTDTLITEYYRVNLVTGRETLIYKETSRESAGLFNPRTGELLTKFRQSPDGNGGYTFETLIRDDETGSFDVHDKLTWTADNRHSIQIVGRDEKTGYYYVSTDQFSNTADIYFYDPVAREYESEPLFALDNFVASGVVLGQKESNFNELLGFRYLGASPSTYWIDPEWDAIVRGLENAYPDRGIGIVDYTDDLSKILFTTESSTYPPAYHILVDKRATQDIGAQRPWIDSDALRPTSLIYYTARDGLRIPGLLTLPKGFTPGEDAPLPAIVLPHGGPWARDYANWDATGWTQFLASRGYAVLQPQYRGSDNWGRSLWRAGDNEWGLKMQDDKDDAAAWLVDQGIADRDQMAIFGYSYGGFAAMAATVREGGPFQCAIAGAGVSNLDRLSNTWSENRVQRALQGRTVDGMDPAENTRHANIPVLVYHGDRDVRVPLFHGRDFYNAVKDRVDAELLVVEDMPHSLPWWPRHHRVTLEAIERFLSTTCGLTPTPPQ